MPRPLVPLPEGYTWRPSATVADTFELTLRGERAVAIAQRRPDGTWLTRTYACFASTRQKEAVAASPRQARRWLQAWLPAARYGIERAFPDVRELCRANAYANGSQG